MFDPIFYPGLCEFTRATSAVQRLYCSVLLRFQDSIIVIFSNVFGEDFFCWVLLFAAEVCFFVSQFQGYCSSCCLFRNCLQFCWFCYWVLVALIIVYDSSSTELQSCHFN